MTKPTPTPYQPTSTDPDEAEQESVHDVYEAIASHFAQTRHKPWPIVAQFLQSLPPNSLGLDSGSGNGKYLPTTNSLTHLMLALDRSSGLLDLARHTGEDGSGNKVNECIRADLGFRGWRPGVVDFTISIAAIHHLSTPIRRRQAVQAIFKPLRLAREEPYARFLIYVWAYEQGMGSRRKMGEVRSAPIKDVVEAEAAGEGGAAEEGEKKGKARVEVGDEVGLADGKIQDVLVPWVLQSRQASRGRDGDKGSTASAGSSHNTTGVSPGQDKEETKVYHRYYHLFTKGELRDLVTEAANAEGYAVVADDKEFDLGLESRWVHVRAEGWEADNWWLEGEVGIGSKHDFVS